MFLLALARLGMGMVEAVERPLELLSTTLATMVGERQGEKFHDVRVSVSVTVDGLERIIRNPDVRQGMLRAEMLKEAGEFHGHDL